MISNKDWAEAYKNRKELFFEIMSKWCKCGQKIKGRSKSSLCNVCAIKEYWKLTPKGRADNYNKIRPMLEEEEKTPLDEETTDVEPEIDDSGKNSDETTI